MSYGDSKIGTPWRGYYITAYGIAVKHGFKGTEEEWLASLQGVDGRSIEIRYNDVTNVLEWKFTDDDAWTQLLDLEQLQTEIVAQTLAQAQAAQQGAEAAQAAAEAAQQEAERNAGVTQADASITQTNVQLSQDAKTAAQAAQAAAETAQQAAEAAQAAAETAETGAEESATLSKSWAVGGTGTRPGEDTNNAEYWAGQAAAAAGGGVISFNGRTGTVKPQSGDYDPRMVGARPNRNLLINAIAIGGGGTGAFPINQRGKTSYTDGTAIDGWKITGNGGQEAAIQEDGILLTSTAQYGAYWIQTVDPNEVASLIGKTLTCSCYMGENSGYRPTASIYRNGEYWKFLEPKQNDIASLTFEVPEGTTSLFFQIGADGAGTTVFKAAKLEESPVQTLGYKDADGNVHILDTPDYGQELARCQRRLLKIGPNGATGYAENPTKAYLFVPIPVTMRAKPIWTGTLPRLHPNDGNSVSSVSVLSIADNMACLMVDGTGFTGGKVYSANEIDGFLSAEL